MKCNIKIKLTVMIFFLLFYRQVACHRETKKSFNDNLIEKEKLTKLYQIIMINESASSESFSSGRQ